MTMLCDSLKQTSKWNKVSEEETAVFLRVIIIFILTSASSVPIVTTCFKVPITFINTDILKIVLNKFCW